MEEALDLSSDRLLNKKISERLLSGDKPATFRSRARAQSEVRTCRICDRQLQPRLISPNSFKVTLPNKVFQINPLNNFRISGDHTLRTMH